MVGARVTWAKDDGSRTLQELTEFYGQDPESAYPMVYSLVFDAVGYDWVHATLNELIEVCSELITDLSDLREDAPINILECCGCDDQ